MKIPHLCCRGGRLRAPASASALAFLFLLGISAPPALAWNSAKVQVGANGELTYPADASGNRIPDFSHAGYRGGGAPLPNVPVMRTVSPVSGDDTANVQAAIDAVGNMAVQASGYRGAVLLNAGVYDIGGTLRLNKSGVVLAGVGDGDSSSSNTILRRTGTSTADVITAGGGADDQFRAEVAGTRRQITTQRVTVGSRSFTVDSAAGYAVGDDIIVLHPSTTAWINAVNQGGVTDSNVWTAGSVDIRYHRYITAISGNTITIDAPVFNHLDRALSQCYIFKYNRAGMLTNIGVEDLQIDIVTAGPTSETHAKTALRFIQAEDCWVRDCTMKHFWYAGVEFASAARCTAERVRAIEPHSVVTGGRRYNFATARAQLVLFNECYATDARHAFVANGTSIDSGNVALNCTLDRNITFSEGHRRWSTGLLFDGCVAINRSGGDVFGFYNRGNYGTGHGWGAAHSVIWRCDAAGGRILVQQPPTAQNYAIGCFGNVTGSGPWAGPVGYIEGANQSGLLPQSLYLAQLAQRQAAPPVAAPTFSPGGGTYGSAQSVTISSATSGASIRYTTNGATPTSTSGTLYSGPVTVSSSLTLRAIAYQSGAPDSPVSSATYTISPGGPTPTKFAIAGGAVLASADDGNVPANTVDGSLATRWSASGDGQWIRYDLGGAHTVSYVRIAFYNGNTRTSSFDVQTSADGASWTTVAPNRTSSGATTTLETFDFADASSVRYVRILGHGNSTNLWNSYTEVEVWGIPGAAPTPAKLAISAPAVTASADDGNVPANTIDGSLATRWSANGDGQWIRFDLGASRTVSFVKIAFYNGASRTSTFDVQVSSDGTSWTTASANRTSSGTTTALETFDFSDAAGRRYVRILGHGNSTNLWNSYTEVEVWGF